MLDLHFCFSTGFYEGLAVPIAFAQAENKPDFKSFE